MPVNRELKSLIIKESFTQPSHYAPIYANRGWSQVYSEEDFKDSVSNVNKALARARKKLGMSKLQSKEYKLTKRQTFSETELEHEETVDSSDLELSNLSKRKTLTL